MNQANKSNKPLISGEGVPRYESDSPPYQPDVDLTAPARDREHPSISDLLERIALNIEQINAYDHADVKYNIRRYDVASNNVLSIFRNENRRSISLYNNGPDIVYVMTSFMDDISEGMPIPVNAEREMKVTCTIYLRSDGASDVQTIEEYT